MNQRGQALPLVAVALVVLLGAAGIAVDTGYHQYQQRMQQTATDSAALAAAREIPAGDYVAAGRQDAQLNGYTDNTGGLACDNTIGRVCVAVNNPPLTGDAYAGNNSAAEVQITVNHPTFFERVMGTTKVAVTTKAVAVLQPKPATNCVYVLNGQANFNGQTGGGAVNAPNCGLIFNQGANFHAATVNAAAIECVPAASSCSQGTFTQSTPVPAAPASDPCIAISFCAKLSSPAPTTCSSPQNLTAGNNAVVTVSPACYGNLDLHKASSVTFKCGFYLITGTLNAKSSGTNPTPIPIGQSCPSGTPGETFYLTGSGSIDFGNDNVTLSAPGSGDYSEWSAGEQNVLFYQAPGDTQTLTLQSASCANSGTGCASNFTGMIYAPDATLNYNKATSTAGGDVLIVAGTLNANGGFNSVYNAPGGPSIYTVQVPVLGE